MRRASDQDYQGMTMMMISLTRNVGTVKSEGRLWYVPVKAAHAGSHLKCLNTSTHVTGNNTGPRRRCRALIPW